MSPSNSTWSEALTAQTREAIEEMLVGPDGFLHFKHKSLGYGSIELNDLASATLILRLKNSDDVLRFVDSGELIDAGWAID